MHTEHTEEEPAENIENMMFVCVYMFGQTRPQVCRRSCRRFNPETPTTSSQVPESWTHTRRMITHRARPHTHRHWTQVSLLCRFCSCFISLSKRILPPFRCIQIARCSSQRGAAAAAVLTAHGPNSGTLKFLVPYSSCHILAAAQSISFD